MSREQADGDGVDRLLDDIRSDWRRLGAAGDETARRQIRQEMQRRFDELRQRLELEADR
jgi:hypothetical protein